MKRFLLILLSVLLSVTLVSCTNQTTTNQATPTDIKVTIWQDFDSYPWDEEPEFETILGEFPDTVFLWKTHRMQSYNEILIQENGEEVSIMEGMPICSAYFVDLNADGYRELCATTWLGSGICDQHIIVYDHHNKETYYLWERAENDYSLYLDNDELKVQKSSYKSGDVIETGTLALEDGQLTIK